MSGNRCIMYKHSYIAIPWLDAYFSMWKKITLWKIPVKGNVLITKLIQKFPTNTCVSGNLGSWNHIMREQVSIKFIKVNLIHSSNSIYTYIVPSTHRQLHNGSGSSIELSLMLLSILQGEPNLFCKSPLKLMDLHQAHSEVKQFVKERYIITWDNTVSLIFRCLVSVILGCEIWKFHFTYTCASLSNINATWCFW